MKRRKMPLNRDQVYLVHSCYEEPLEKSLWDEMKEFYADSELARLVNTICDYNLAIAFGVSIGLIIGSVYHKPYNLQSDSLDNEIRNDKAAYTRRSGMPIEGRSYKPGIWKGESNR